LEALRYRENGSENPDFILNKAKFRNAPILIAADNFGCGSSREAAVWALMARGIRCVIAQSFGDIFYNNCFQNGLLPIRLAEECVERLAGIAATGAEFHVDLPSQHIAIAGEVIPFEIDPSRKESLLHGMDAIGLTLRTQDQIKAWQAADRKRRPWAWLR
jgi:3-isopropylmalate/(R)-2-methylmalate dehydratase small subunit